MTLPAVFLSHGAPTLATANNVFTHAWSELAVVLGRPAAILVVSAHWDTPFTAITTAERLETIHDFAGFPHALYEARYDAMGSPALAARAAALIKGAGIDASVNACRGIDHGAWVPLRWMYPAADVPVVQLSVQADLGAAHHLRVGEALAPLREEGVLVIGSGHVTHNLRDWAQHRGDPQPAAYAVAFADWLEDRLVRGEREALLGWRELAPFATRAHPTEEHFLPLFVALGAAGAGARATRFHRAIEAAVLSMDAYRFD